MSVCNPRSFHDAARWQRACAACGAIGKPFQAHHVVAKSWLKARGLELYDPRGALRLCAPGTTGNCHMQHEFGGPGKVEIPLVRLPLEAIEYAIELMGYWPAHQYLTSHYSGADGRLDKIALL